MSTVVLITGVSRFLGGQLAARLAADPEIERVIGIDTVAPRTSELAALGRTEFVRADIRNPLIAKVMTQARVGTVVHAALMASPRLSASTPQPAAPTRATSVHANRAGMPELNSGRRER